MDIESMDRRLKLGALIVALLVGAILVGAGTYAFWSDTGSSTSNTAEAGTMDVTIDGVNDGVTGNFSLTNAQPGETAGHTFTLRNAGSTAGDHAEVGVSFVENDTRTEPADSQLGAELTASDTARQIEVTTFEYRNDTGATIEDVLAGVTDSNSNGIKDLDEVVSQAGTTDDLAPPQAGSGNTTSLVVDVAVADDDGAFTGTDEDVMADGLDVAIDFTLNQDSTQ
jgi:predicted ribosomally synthesized peptide with SipW-like signal peptide